MRANAVKTAVNSVPHGGINTIDVEGTIPESPLRQRSDQERWCAAVANNKPERLCRGKLEKRIANQPEGEKDYEVYIASQEEMCLLPNGKHKQVDRIVFCSIVFIRCIDVLCKKEIVHLPYIKHFMINIAGERFGGIHPVAFIPDEQIVKLHRMLDDPEEPITIDPRSLPPGARVCINGGKLYDLEGNVLEVKDDNLNFVIRVDLLGCARVNITRDLLGLLRYTQMDTHYDRREGRSRACLIPLLGNRSKKILKRESDNRAFIHLYCTGPYWVAFEKSAYLLRQISSRTLVIPLSLITCPFPVAMASWTDGGLRSYTRNHFFHREGNDYGRLSVPTRTLDGYKEWHKEEVRYLLIQGVKDTSMNRDVEIS